MKIITWYKHWSEEEAQCVSFGAHAPTIDYHWVVNYNAFGLRMKIAYNITWTYLMEMKDKLHMLKSSKKFPHFQSA